MVQCGADRRIYCYAANIGAEDIYDIICDITPISSNHYKMNVSNSSDNAQ